MSCRFAALFVFFLLRVQSIDLSHALPFSSLLDFDLPEIDGSAVDTCMIFSDTTVYTTIATTTTTTTTPVTRKQVVATTKKPAVQTPQRKPETRNTRTPIRPQPAPSRPITDNLLVNSRRHAAGSLPGFSGFLSQPMGGLPHRLYSPSDSDESAAAPPIRAGRTDTNTRKISLFSSEDSSDES